MNVYEERVCRKCSFEGNHEQTRYKNLIIWKCCVCNFSTYFQQEDGKEISPQMVFEMYPELLKECEDINFIGSIEARDIPQGLADVIVCEAFVGNVILKLYEGLAGVLIKKIKGGLMSTLKSKIGAALALPALKNTLKSFDTSEHGGAPLLGLNGLVVKTHGSSKAIEVSNSIIQCVTFKEQKINDKIRERIQVNE